MKPEQEPKKDDVPDDEVPIGREEYKVDLEKDTIEVVPGNISKAENFDELYYLLRNGGYSSFSEVEKIIDHIDHSRMGLFLLFGDKEKYHDMETAIANVFENNEDLFLHVNLYNDEVKKALKDKVMHLLKNDLENYQERNKKP